MEWATTTQILDDLKFSNNSTAWKTFTDHFYPIIIAFAKRMGLSSCDAEDVAQETVIQFLKLYRDNRYQKEKGHLSHWIFGVAHNVIRDFVKKKPKECHIPDRGTQTSFFASVQDDKAILHTWQTEWRRIVLERCLSRVRNEVDQKTYRVFEMYALDQQSVDDVCSQVGITPNAVYIAKNRVLTKIRELKKQYDE